MTDVKYAELQPCPFCGGTDLVVLRGMAESFVQCNGCEASASFAPEDAAAITAWNTRADATCALRGAQIPDGWKLIPFKPTEDMCRAAVVFANGCAVYKNLPAAVLEIEEGIYGEVFEAMLAAAPKPNSYGCTCQSGKCPHASSCAVHNAPAYLPGPCDCGVISPPTPEGEAK